MAKKAASTEFNMSQAIRDALGENKGLSANETIEAILKKHPGAKINKNSFSVAFYTIKQKLGIGKRKGKRVGIRKSKAGRHTSSGSVDLIALQSAAKFLRDAGSLESAMAAIKTVDAMQIR